ncbi:flagellar hook-length control protein FliK [Rheinheimera riviphila]|uniref:Flagellar hook-length control protein FliK n=1 Tax=Rheinheimera riviphila TaxID=1834037 RepID=A0A437R3M0_9GAMM|nr:flagellar hook-length control protein FliK [Rheinheimera riviphila]RVU41325.1 flagellar hook-length control protein FliK [Rheinheimera riviphila]
MHIDKSFQLLSADNSKLAADETWRQNAADDEAEFSELLDAELDSQEQQSNAVTDKKTGQEVAALVMQQAQTAKESQAESALAAKALAEKILADTPGDCNSQAATDAVAAQQASTITVGSEEAAVSQTDTVALDKEQPTNQSPWLAIISQSHDFNAILSQSSAPSTTASTAESLLTTAESVAADLLGVPVTEQAATMALQMADAAQTAEQLQGEKNATSGTALASLGEAATMLADAALANIAEGKQDATTPSAANQADDAAVDAASIQAKLTGSGVDSDRVVNTHPAKLSAELPAEQMNVRELLKTDQPDQQSQVGAASEQQAATPTEQQTLASTAATTTSAAPVTSGVMQQLSAGSVAAQLSQIDGKGHKSSVTAPVDVELPIDVSPDFTTPGTILAGVTTAATTAREAKNAAPSFAQFQKAANAAASLVQKQQQAEQTQSQPLQELAAQQSPKLSELSVVLSGQHTDTPTAFNTLLQTERPISSSGSAMGSSTGQQQQQAASQLFAAKLNDHLSNNEQPSLNLLEPTAAAQLKERVMFQVNQKIQSAEIRLAPEELGSMQIKVQMQQEQLSVQFVVQQAGAKEALEQQMPRLREMLEEQGIELTQGQVSQQREGSAEQRQTRERNQGLDQGTDIGDEPLQQQAIVRVSDRMVDYYA